MADISILARKTGEIKILRVDRNIFCTMGVLLINDFAFCVTLEPPDYNNEPIVSCIPEGRYNCVAINSPKFGQTFRVEDVPGRENILFHPGNIAEDTTGCIILGRGFGVLYGDNRAVLNSGATFRQFIGRMQNRVVFGLEIKNCVEKF